MARKKRVDSKSRVLKVGESQRKDGLYMYRFTDDTGKRQTIYANNIIELREQEQEIEKNLLNGINYSSVTLNQWFNEYIEICKKEKLKELIYTRYKQYWDWYVKDKIGKMKVKDIKRMNVMKFYSNYINGSDGVKLSGGTIKYVNNLLYLAFEYAVNNDIILKNPCTKILRELVTEPKKERTALTKEEQQLFFDYISNTTDSRIKGYYPLFVVGFGTGLRIGELLALTWDDVDLKNNVIHVNKTIYYQPQDNGKRKQRITTPKTKNSFRTVPILSEVRKALHEQRKQQFMLGINDSVEIDGYKGFVFTTTKGTPYISDGINRIIKRICKNINKQETQKAEKENREAIEMPEFSAHIMRHTFCTRLCENDLNVKTTQSIMGHADIKTTMNIYTHVTEEKKQQELSKLNNIKIS